jgi:hypothetical protein
MAHAAPNSRVGLIGAYKSAAIALASSAQFAVDQAALTAAQAKLSADMLANAPAATISLDQAAVAAAQTAVSADVAPAAAALAAASNKGITAGTVSTLDSKLGVNLDAASSAALAAQAASLQH